MTVSPRTEAAVSGAAVCGPAGGWTAVAAGAGCAGVIGCPVCVTLSPAAALSARGTGGKSTFVMTTTAIMRMTARMNLPLCISLIHKYDVMVRAPDHARVLPRDGTAATCA